MGTGPESPTDGAAGTGREAVMTQVMLWEAIRRSLYGNYMSS